MRERSGEFNREPMCGKRIKPCGSLEEQEMKSYNWFGEIQYSSVRHDRNLFLDTNLFRRDNDFSYEEGGE